MALAHAAHLRYLQFILPTSSNRPSRRKRTLQAHVRYPDKDALPWVGNIQPSATPVPWTQTELISRYYLSGNILPQAGLRWRGEGKDEEIQVVTFLTSDSIVQLPSRHSRVSIPQRVHEPLPDQGLCIGASFTIAATNGVDPTRRLALLGFCRSVDQLSEVVEDCVLRRGGEIMLHHVELRSGLHEILKMTVAIPLLYGIPPEHEYLRSAISSGGGFVEKMSRQWQMY